MRRVNNIGYYIKEGFASIFSHGLMSFAAVCMIVACLIIMGSFSLLAVNVDANLKQLEDENEFLVYIDENYSKQEADHLAYLAGQVDNVASVTYITRQQAKAAYLEKHPSDGLYIPDEVFRDRLSVHVVDLERFNETVDAVCSLPGAVDHRAEGELAEGFVHIRNAVTALALVLVGILVAVSLFIISNTTRLAAFARREEIAIMKMCGATNAFVRWPFIVEGLMLGLTGAVVAFFLQWGIYAAVGKAVVNSGAATLLALVKFGDIWADVLRSFLLAGGAIGALGSGLAIRKFLQV